MKTLDTKNPTHSENSLTHEVYTTIADVEEHWGSDYSEWGLLGGEVDRSERIRFVREKGDHEWRMERRDDSVWYVALDATFEGDDVPGNALEAIANAAHEIGLDYSIEEDGAVNIPGYGLVFWDDQNGVEPGLVVRSCADDCDYPAEGAQEVIDELRSI